MQKANMPFAGFRGEGRAGRVRGIGMAVSGAHGVLKSLETV